MHAIAGSRRSLSSPSSPWRGTTTQHSSPGSHYHRHFDFSYVSHLNDKKWTWVITCDELFPRSISEKNLSSRCNALYLCLFPANALFSLPQKLHKTAFDKYTQPQIFQTMASNEGGDNNEEGRILLESNDGFHIRLSLSQARKCSKIIRDYESICGSVEQSGTITLKTPWDLTSLNHYVCLALAIKCYGKVDRPHLWDKDHCELTYSELSFCKNISLSLFSKIFRIAQYYDNDCVIRVMSRYLARIFSGCSMNELQAYVGTPQSDYMSEIYLKGGSLRRFGLHSTPQIATIWTTNGAECDWLNFPQNKRNSNLYRTSCVQSCDSLTLISNLKHYKMDYHFIEINPISNPINLSMRDNEEEIIVVD